MATSAIDLDDIYLWHRRFGKPSQMVPPKGGITGSSHHNATSEVYPVGTIIQIEHPGVAGIPGWSEFVYGTYDEHAAGTPAIRQVLSPSVITDLFDFGHDPGQVAVGFLGVITISVMTDGRWGWFWSGGVAPIDLVSDSDFEAADEVVTNENVAALTGFYAVTDAGTDQCLGICAAGIAQMGVALKTDNI